MKEDISFGADANVEPCVSIDCMCFSSGASESSSTSMLLPLSLLLFFSFTGTSRSNRNKGSAPAAWHAAVMKNVKVYENLSAKMPPRAALPHQPNEETLSNDLEGGGEEKENARSG